MGKKSRQKRQKQHNKPVSQPGRAQAVAPLTATMLGQRLNQTPADQINRNLVVADYGYVRGDIKRTFVILTALIALLITVVILNIQTPWIAQLGSRLADFFQL